jgi:hypothetical protein
MLVDIALVKLWIKDNNIKINIMDDYEVNLIAEEISEFINTKNTTYDDTLYNHKLLPIVDVDTGRPQLKELKCKHNNCGLEFENKNLLIQHLEIYNQYKKKYSKSHENTSYSYRNNIYYCGSPFCNFKTNYKMSIQQHYKLLGIEPFYVKHTEIPIQEYIEYYNKTNNNNTQSIGIDKISILIKFLLNESPSECCICMDEEANMMFFPCYHNIVCSNCIKHLQQKKCPLCRLNYECCIKK